MLQHQASTRLRVVPHLSSGIVASAKRAAGREKNFFHFSLSLPVSPFLARGDFYVRSRFARSTIKKNGGLLVVGDYS